MDVLIVVSDPDLAATWQAYLLGEVGTVDIACNTAVAVDLIGKSHYDVIIVDVILGEGEAGLAVSDYAQYRRPDASVIFVTDTEVFSDGSIFSLAPNARAFLPSSSQPADIAALIEHYGTLRTAS